MDASLKGDGGSQGSERDTVLGSRLVVHRFVVSGAAGGTGG